MPRPLKILKGINEQDPDATRDKISKLLGETVTTAAEALRQLSECLHLLLNLDRASKADQSIVDLVVRFWNDIKAANILIREGLILNSMMMQRDSVETRVVAEYLHTYPREAEAWEKADTFKERRRFSINELKDKVKDGEAWKDVWDFLSSYIHPNDQAKPVYAKERPFFGYNLYIGGFYDPGPIATLFTMQLAICINFLDSITSWYEANLPFFAELRRKIDALEDTYRNQTNKLGKRADLEQKRIDSEIEATRLSEDEIISLLKFLDTST